MRVEGPSADKAAHFSAILEVTPASRSPPPPVLPRRAPLHIPVSSLPGRSQLFEVAPAFLMVDIQKAAGDSADYLKARSSSPPPLHSSLCSLMLPRRRVGCRLVFLEALTIRARCSSTRAFAAKWTTSSGSLPPRRADRASPSCRGADLRRRRRRLT